MGLAIQGGLALMIGLFGSRFLPRNAGKMLMAGALSAPVETAIVSWDVPFLADALSPATAAAQVGAYYGMNAYVYEPGAPSLNAYVMPSEAPALAGYEYEMGGYGQGVQQQ